MGALLAGSRELGPDEYHHWLNHVRNCEACTGPFVKTLIAQLIYLMLCGIRLIPHGTRQGRVCIFRYTWASSCHGWNSYGTRRPRVCGIPYVTSSCVPAGGMTGTLLPPVYGIPANWGQACAAGAPPGTRPARVSCGRANSTQVCTGAQHRPHSRGPSSRRACKLAAEVYRRLSPAYSPGPSFVQPCKLGPGVYRAGRRPYSSGPSLRRPCKLAAEVYRASTRTDPRRSDVNSLSACAMSRRSRIMCPWS